MTLKKERQHWNKEAVKSAASGRWIELFSRVGGFDAPDPGGSSCVKCGGDNRAFRHTDFDETGGIGCRHCFTSDNQDGIAAISWFTGWPFPETVDRIGEYLGVQPEGKPSLSASKSSAKRNRVGEVEIDPVWPTDLAAYWCMTNPPITQEGLHAIGAAPVRLDGKGYIGFPGLDQFGVVNAWTIRDWANGPLIVGRGKNRRFVKTKLVEGSKGGTVIGSIDGERFVWKVEGPKDLASLYSDGLPDGHSAFSTSCGAGEKPEPWLLERLSDKLVLIVLDADQSAENGAKEWSKAFSSVGISHRLVRLPFPAGTKKDLQDFFAEGNTIDDLREIARNSPSVEIAPPELRVDPKKIIVEAVDDPDRLALANIDFYEHEHGGKLVCWNSEFFAWEGTKYRRKSDHEIKDYLWNFINQEFAQEYLDAVATRKEVEHKRKVSFTIVSNTLAALKAKTRISKEHKLPSWIDGQDRSDVIAAKNGLIDLGKIAEIDFSRDDKDSAHLYDCLLPHDPSWFSTICLKYEYDPNARCDKWREFLRKSLEGNEKKISLLQEWAGYLLLPETSHHKFLALQGSGANGKSVFFAAMTAMLGEENVSNIPIESFGDKFQLVATLGKLANIVGEVPEESMPEAKLKAFTSGDRMTFENKGKPAFESYPTARLMFACNDRPRFTDRTMAIWRRMLWVPFGRPIPEKDRVHGMDKPQWWIESGELPGVLNWAIAGLYRLRKNGRFSQSEEMADQIEGYRRESNPSREFIADNYIETESQDDLVKCSDLFERYSAWSKAGGFYPLNANKLGQIIREIFPGVSRVRLRVNRELGWYYSNMAESKAEIWD